MWLPVSGRRSPSGRPSDGVTRLSVAAAEQMIWKTEEQYAVRNGKTHTLRLVALKEKYSIHEKEQ